ncbi:unnamed protein product, partial [Trichogramma brassicae]
MGLNVYFLYFLVNIIYCVVNIYLATFLASFLPHRLSRLPEHDQVATTYGTSPPATIYGAERSLAFPILPMVDNGNNGGPSRAAVGQMRATRAAAQTRVASASRCCQLGARPTPAATRSAFFVEPRILSSTGSSTPIRPTTNYFELHCHLYELRSQRAASRESGRPNADYLTFTALRVAAGVGRAPSWQQRDALATLVCAAALVARIWPTAALDGPPLLPLSTYLLRLVCTVDNGNNGGPSRAAVGQMRATRAAAQTRVASASRCCQLGARPTPAATRSAFFVEPRILSSTGSSTPIRPTTNYFELHCHLYELRSQRAASRESGRPNADYLWLHASGLQQPSTVRHCYRCLL